MAGSVRIRCRVERDCFRERRLVPGDETIYEGDPDKMPSWMTPLEDAAEDDSPKPKRKARRKRPAGPGVALSELEVPSVD